MVAVLNVFTGSKTEDLAFVQPAVLVVFNILNHGSGSGKMCFPDAACQPVLLASVPFRVNHYPVISEVSPLQSFRYFSEIVSAMGFKLLFA